MRTRLELVRELVANPSMDSAALQELGTYGWDCDSPLVELSKADIVAVLQKFRDRQLTADQVNSWAKRVEYRDDIECDGGGDGVVNEAIFWLANPYLNYPIDDSLCDRIGERFKE